MPWNPLRTTKGGDPGGLRRHSTIDPTQPTEPAVEHASNDINPLGHDSLDVVSSPSPLRKSFEPPATEDATGINQAPLYEELQPPKRNRFSMLSYRHRSDPQISKTAREHAVAVTPPMPAAPSIITTAPTESFEAVPNKKPAFTLPRHRKAPELPRSLSSKQSNQSLSEATSGQGFGDVTSANQSGRQSRITFDQPERLHGLVAPPAYGDNSSSSLALPVSRLSESSRSEGSLGDHGVYATTTTTHTVSTTTTFFRLPRRKKNKGPLFPLPVKIPPAEPTHNAALTPRASTGAQSHDSPRNQSPSRFPPLTAIHRPFHIGHDGNASSSALTSPSQPPGHMSQKDSGNSSPILAGPSPSDRRPRSSTKGSLRQSADEPLPTPPLPQSGRTSSSTGRASLGGLFNLSRLRQNSEPQQIRHAFGHPPMPGTPLSNGSKAHSFNLTREPTVVPERLEGDTPAKYLIRLEEAVSRGVVATILSQSNDEFFKNVLRSYMRGFKFFGDPLDMSTRKLLMEVELPKETQQIDRVLQAFANRYHECNPGVYASPDEAYFIAFSILILHTDVFNKNNKHKMQKQDYTKNARSQGVADEILECFYDNISYTPFIHVDDDIDINGERIVARKPKKNLFTKQSTDSLGKPSREPVDPYTLILDNRIDSLRPSLKDVMNLEDHYSYLGTASSLNIANLNKTFSKSGILQLVSSRSRPEAFTSPETMANPAEAHPGVVDVRITKVGILWRKDMKKKKARSPWQEWGAILTLQQLYFFRNTTWIKNLIHQHDSHHKHGYAGSPVIFKPPVEQFKSDVMMSTEAAVALLDTSYKKHKHAFVFVRHGGFEEETFLADNEDDMNDWLAKLNYAAAFRTAGVRMRGLIGGVNDGERIRGMRRMDSSTSAQSTQSAVSDPVSSDGKFDVQAHQIQAARRQILAQKIAEADAKLSEAGKLLELQLRNARHLQILAPIQNKTRELVVLAAGGMNAKIKWSRMEIWRTRCHRDILAMDLEEDLKSGGAVHIKIDISSSSTQQPSSPGGQSGRKTEARQSYLGTPTSNPRVDVTARPATQPSPTKTFNMDDVFASLQRAPLESGHAPKGSWELPPLSFQPTKTSLKSASSTGVNQQNRHTLVPQPSSQSVSDSAKISDADNIAAKLASPSPDIDNNEQELLQEAGLVEPDSPSAGLGKRPETPTDRKERTQDRGKTRESEINEAKAKVRRSLHRTLRDSHPPGHHRSRKGKDSASSGGLGEDGPSVGDSEGLARGTGSFTVHGKKASVINFGSEWQSMSPEERLKLRKQAPVDESRLSVPSEIENETSSIRSSTFGSAARPISTLSASTATLDSAPFEDATTGEAGPAIDPVTETPKATQLT